MVEFCPRAGQAFMFALLYRGILASSLSWISYPDFVFRGKPEEPRQVSFGCPLSPFLTSLQKSTVAITGVMSLVLSTSTASHE